MGVIKDANPDMSSDLSAITGGNDIAILLDDAVDKYNPGMQAFRLQSATALQPNTTGTIKSKFISDNLMNKDPIKCNPVTKAAVVMLQLPREVCRQFKTKFIPVGTTFNVTYTGGDLTKPVIVGREFDPTIEDEESSNSSSSTGGI